jgi:hypothetical protein
MGDLGDDDLGIVGLSRITASTPSMTSRSRARPRSAKKARMASR